MTAKKKNVISLILVLVMCLSLCACGAQTPEDVAGTYLYVSKLGSGYPFWLNADSTYDSSHWGRGTYTVDRNKIVLHQNNNETKTTTLVKYGDFYCLPTFEPLKDNYGRTVTFSKDGRINHYISWSSSGILVNTREAHKTELTFREDGTFQLVEAFYRDDQLKQRNEHEGTYELEDNILTFTCDDFIFYLLYTEKGLSRHVYKRYTMDDTKNALIGRWQSDVDEGESLAFTFNEDGTAIQQTSSGDIKYTYDILEGGQIDCTGSDGSHIMLQYGWSGGRLFMYIDEEPWGRYFQKG